MKNLNYSSLDIKKVTISLEQLNLLNFYIFNHLFIFVLQNTSSYLRMPKEIQFIKENNNFIFYSNKVNKLIFFSFYTNFLNFLKNDTRLFTKKLILKGLGFRILIYDINDKKYFRFKLGFSHLIDILIPQNKINFTLKKNIINLESRNIVFLHNFAKKIKNLKNPNIYTGKGFWYKKEQLLLKTFKKR